MIGDDFRGSRGGRVMSMTAVKFDVGQLIVTPTASAALEADGETVARLLERHQAGDWGDVTQHERSINDQGLETSLSLQSVYHTRRGQKIIFVTRADRTMTLVHVMPPS